MNDDVRVPLWVLSMTIGVGILLIAIWMAGHGEAWPAMAEGAAGGLNIGIGYCNRIFRQAASTAAAEAKQ